MMDHAKERQSNGSRWGAVKRFPNWLWGVFMVAAMMAVYFPCLQGAFVWDDFAWTYRVEALLQDFSGLWRMWSTPTALQQYFPLTGTTFWLDHQLWGGWTLPYHLESVLLHALASLLFWRLLSCLKVPGAWLAAGILALHPVMVDSVAWIAERKNVLSLVFFLGSLLAYGKFASFWTDDAGPGRRRGYYLLALLLFLGALLSKITACSLPAVILLICWWKRGRIRWRADVLPTLPYFAL